MKSIKFRCPPFLPTFFVVLSLVSTSGWAEDIFWANSDGGNWAVADNWNPARVPDAEDHALIVLDGAYVVTLNAAANIAALTVGGESGTQTFSTGNQSLTIGGSSVVGGNAVFAMSGGTLSGSGVLTVHGSLAWTAGLMTGEGRTIVAEGATLTLSGNSSKNLDAGRVLENRGTIQWSGGEFNLNLTPAGGSGRIENTASGLFDIQIAGESIRAAGFADVNTAPLPSFTNAGTVRKSTSASSTSIAVPFTNSGTTEVHLGTLRLTGLGSNVGTVDVAAGATLAPQTFRFEAGSQLDGEGLYLFDSGTQTVLSDQTVPHLSFTAGTIAGGSDLVVSETFNWIGGTMTDTGRTIVAEGVTLALNGTSAKNLDAGRVLENRGTIQWSGGEFNLNSTPAGGSGRIENSPSGLFDIQIAGESIRAAGFGDVNTAPLPSFTNAGTLRKSTSASSTSIAVPFTNSGTTEVHLGTLRLTGLGSNVGTFDVTAGATLAPQTFRFEAGSQLDGEGLYLFDSGTQTVLTHQTIPHLRFTTGTIAGGSNVVVSETFNWIGGTMTGAGRTIVPEGVTLVLSGTSSKNLDAGRVLENRGTMQWSGGDFNLNSTPEGGSGRIENTASGLFDIQIAGESIRAAGFGDVNTAPLPSFTNAGTVRRSVSSSSTGLSVPFTNSGTVEMRTGTLHASSLVTIGPESTLRFVIGGPSLGADYGQFRANGALTLNGDVEFVLTNGFVPTADHLVTIVSAGTRVQTFADVQGNVLPNSVFLNPVYTLQEVLVEKQDARPILRNGVGTPSSQYRMNGIAGQRYRIRATSDLLDQVWVFFDSFIVSGSTYIDFVDPEAKEFQQRFYAAEFLPAE